MNTRSELITELTQALDATSVGVSSELPWFSGNQVLNEKNMRNVYMDHEQIENTTLIETLDNSDVYEQIIEIPTYLTVDAKRLPSDISDVIQIIRHARQVIDAPTRECDMITTIEDDKLTYEFTYRFIKICCQ
jgi:hypothetical protein